MRLGRVSGLEKRHNNSTSQRNGQLVREEKGREWKGQGPSALQMNTEEELVAVPAKSGNGWEGH